PLSHVSHSLSYSTSVLVPCFSVYDPATTTLDTLSLHDALPISERTCIMTQPIDIHTGTLHGRDRYGQPIAAIIVWADRAADYCPDRKSTRLNSSHVKISYAVFCLKKKKGADL